MLKPNDIVIYNDDLNRIPYLVHDTTKSNKVSLGVMNYPDIEQDFYTPISQLTKLSGKELKDAKKIISAQMV